MDWANWFLLAGIAAFAGVALIPTYANRAGRALPEDVCSELADIPPHRPRQHVVDLELRDGRLVRKVWIADGKYPAVLGGRTVTQRYLPRDVVHARPRVDSRA